MHSFQKWLCFLPFGILGLTAGLPLFWNQSGARMPVLLALLLLALPLLLTLQKFVAFVRLADASHQLQREPNQQFSAHGRCLILFGPTLARFSGSRQNTCNPLFSNRAKAALLSRAFASRVETCLRPRKAL